MALRIGRRRESRRTDGAPYELALQAMTEVISVNRAAILLLDCEGVMRFTASQGLSETHQQAAEGHSPGQRIRRTRPLVIENVARCNLSPELQATVRGEGIEALAFIPSPMAADCSARSCCASTGPDD